ncbi:immunity 42 family protein [Dickeya sp. NCPPB 3274]|uniref:immunity 42 family protein n=1 Tax=Dickeya sp. NCPPB 3274 TaxID=568766 RepID=UPI0005B36E8F|nr:immunity 42 family protein [Dickeya sp. NCPPB 3274]
MIYGDPFYFALQFDVVEHWTSPGDIWKNGLFSLYLDGRRIFDVVDVFELKTTFGFYSKSPVDGLIVNDLIVDAVTLYRNAESYFTGDGDVLIDGLFDLTCTAMGDNGYYLYFMKTSSSDRLVWSIDDGKEIHEVLLPSGTICNVINDLRDVNL